MSSFELRDIDTLRTAPLDTEQEIIQYAYVANTTLNQARAELLRLSASPSPSVQFDARIAQSQVSGPTRESSMEENAYYHALLHSCRSGVHHHSYNAQETMAHYFGCLNSSERRNFFDELTVDSQGDELSRQIIEEQRRIIRLRAILDAERYTTERGELFATFRETLQNRFAGPQRIRPPETLAFQHPEHQSSGAENNDDFVLSNVEANVVYFKKSHSERNYLRPYDHPELPGLFPNQEIPMSEVLTNNQKRNPVMWACEDDTIRYFHLPANNMAWVENIISRYYHESTPNLDLPYRTHPRYHPEPNTRMLLLPQFWRNLESISAHSRHLHPRFFPISTDRHSVESEANNIALFMPYLHWETDRARAKAVDTMKRIYNTGFALPDVVVDASTIISSDLRLQDGIATSLEFLSARIQGIRARHCSLLGRFLLLAAALKEEFDSYTDERLIERYIKARPGLHPRRTLDQSHYWMLKDTVGRDRDQVVYRDTAASPQNLHHICTDKTARGRHTPCRQCLENVRKVPRIVMVDQLWLWILDDRTIITCFPKRWGKSSREPSDVHESIRTRLRLAQDDEIRSAFDVAIIIMEQCTRVFFSMQHQERDLEPLTIEAFVTAIRRLSNKQAIAFGNFWETTRFTSSYKFSWDNWSTLQMKMMKRRILDITPEGGLLLEVRDVIDELNIMIAIKVQEETVTRAFVEHLITHFKSRESVGSKWTLKSANNLLNSVRSQISELQSLKGAAEETAQAFKDLIALKQQQSGVIEAQESVKQGEVALKQGDTVMLFTIVTIIFLPLSFFTGIFGMNATEINGSNWTVNSIITYMIPISVTIIFFSLLLGFNEAARTTILGPLNIIMFGINIAGAWIVTHTRLYTLWRNMTFNSSDLKYKEREYIARLKSDALRAEFDRKIRKDKKKIEKFERKQIERDQEYSENRRRRLRVVENV